MSWPSAIAGATGWSTRRRLAHDPGIPDMLSSMFKVIAPRLRLLILMSAIAGCVARAAPQIILPDGARTLAELMAQYPLAAGQPVRAERLGASASVSYHFIQLAPGAGERPHLHAQHDLVVMLLRGSGIQWIRDQSLALKAGDSVVVPAGTPHRFVNTGDNPAAAFIVFSPPHDGSDQVFLGTR